MPVTVNVRQILLEVHVGARWTPTTAFLAGQHVRPRTDNARYYVALQDGETGGSEPDWTELPAIADDGQLWQDAGADPIADIQWVRCRYSVQEPVASAQFMSPVLHGNYNDEVTIACGASPGYGPEVRFVGYMRDPSGELWPRAVTHNLVGRLQRAAEYFNSESSGGTLLQNGDWGLLAPSILDPAWDPNAGVAGDYLFSAGTMVQAVLARVGVPFDPANIRSTTIAYGLPFLFDYVWHATAPPLFAIIRTPSQAESALAYIQRYDEIDAEWAGEGHYWQGGFYRTMEGVGGMVYRWRIGGKPYGSEVFTFTEGVNILEGNIQRHYPQGNRLLVTGKSYGPTQMRYLAVRSNPFMPRDMPRMAPNGVSSEMILMQGITRDGAIGGFDDQGVPVDGAGNAINVSVQVVAWAQADFTALWLSQGGQLPEGCTVFGQNCQTVAEAALLEVNKETPSGQITTADDFPFTQAQTVLIQAPGGAVGRLLSGETFLIQGVTVDCGHGTEGEPLFKQSLEVSGGGLDSNSAVSGTPPDPEFIDEPPPEAEEEA